jgi:hypothetical protein
MLSCFENSIEDLKQKNDIMKKRRGRRPGWKKNTNIVSENLTSSVSNEPKKSLFL